MTGITNTMYLHHIGVEEDDENIIFFQLPDYHWYSSGKDAFLALEKNELERLIQSFGVHLRVMVFSGCYEHGFYCKCNNGTKFWDQRRKGLRCGACGTLLNESAMRLNPYLNSTINLCYNMGIIPKDWLGRNILPLEGIL